MTPRVMWQSLRSLGVRFILDGPTFRVQAPSGVLMDEHKQFLKAHKPEIVSILRDTCSECGSQLYETESITPRRCLTCRRSSDPGSPGSGADVVDQ